MFWKTPGTTAGNAAACRALGAPLGSKAAAPPWARWGNVSFDHHDRGRPDSLANRR